MKELCRITVNHVDPNDLAPNRKRHWGTRAKKTATHQLLAEHAWRAAGCPVAWGAVAVQVIIRRQRTLDPDNALASCKALIDGLFKQRITVDDSRQYCTWLPVAFETGKRFKCRESVEFIVYEKE